LALAHGIRTGVDRRGRRPPRSRPATTPSPGTLGILELGAACGMIDLSSTLAKLASD